jgi:multicomponent K+:H+ antiporter subunit G
MTPTAELPDWAALLTAILFLLGATLTLIGTIGLVRFRSFYRRVHAPTLGTTFGMMFVLIGSMLFFSVLQDRLIVHEILIIVFVTMTTPITLMLLVRAALARDLQEGSPEVSTLRDSNIH